MYAHRYFSIVTCGLALAAASLAQNQVPVRSGFGPLDLGAQTASCNPGINNCANASSNLLVADFGLSPGYNSIAFGIGAGKVLLVYRDPNTGTWKLAPGWPQTLPTHAISTPAAADLDENGTVDLVIGFGSTFSGNEAPGGVRAFNRAGGTLWTYNTFDVVGNPDGSDPVISSPAIDDIDGDTHQEVIFAGIDHRIHVVDGRNGTVKAGWPKRVCDTSFSSPALYDMDGDGLRDIIVGSDSAIGSDDVAGYNCAGNTSTKGHLWAFKYDGTLIAGFPKQIADQVVSSSPAVGDIDGDGVAEIVHGTGTFFMGDTPKLYAWELNGSAVSGWPVNTSDIGHIKSSPALADLDGDGFPEVIVTAEKTVGSLYYLAAYNGSGTRLFASEVRDFFNASLSAGDPMVGDIFDDPSKPNSDPEIVVPTNGELVVFNASGTLLTDHDNFTGDPTDEPSMMTQFSVSNAAIADLETNGAGSKIEVLAASATSDGLHTTLWVWNPVNRATAPLWGQARHDARHFAVFPLPTAIFSDGFESGNVLGWSKAAQ